MTPQTWTTLLGIATIAGVVLGGLRVHASMAERRARSRAEAIVARVRSAPKDDAPRP